MPEAGAALAPYEAEFDFRGELLVYLRGKEGKWTLAWSRMLGKFRDKGHAVQADSVTVIFGGPTSLTPAVIILQRDRDWAAAVLQEAGIALSPISVAHPAKPLTSRPCARRVFGRLLGDERREKSAWSHAALLVGTALAGCGKSPPPVEPAPPTVVAAPLVRDVRDWDDYAGRFEGRRCRGDPPARLGHAAIVHFRDGQNVKKGSCSSRSIRGRWMRSLRRPGPSSPRPRRPRRTPTRPCRRGKTLIQNHLISESDLELLSAQAQRAAADVAAEVRPTSRPAS